MACLSQKTEHNPSAMNYLIEQKSAQNRAFDTALPQKSRHFHLYFATALLALFLGSAQAQDTQPKPIETSSPEYPPSLLDSGMDGTAIITVIVKADGSVSNATIKSADHPAFGKAAMDVIGSWRFSPATKDGKAIDADITIPMEFTAPIHQKLNGMLGRNAYRLIPEPILEQKDFGKKLKIAQKASPQYPYALRGSGIEPKVHVKFVVAPDGTTLNPEVLDAPRREFVMPAITAVARTIYQSPRKDGKGVYVSTTITLKFKEKGEEVRNDRNIFRDTTPSTKGDENRMP